MVASSASLRSRRFNFQNLRHSPITLLTRSPQRSRIPANCRSASRGTLNVDQALVSQLLKQSEQVLFTQTFFHVVLAD